MVAWQVVFFRNLTTTADSNTSTVSRQQPLILLGSPCTHGCSCVTLPPCVHLWIAT